MKSMPKGRLANIPKGTWTPPRVLFWPCQKKRCGDCAGTMRSMFGLARCVCKCHRNRNAQK